MEQRTLHRIPLDQIIQPADAHRQRIDPDELQELARSIAEVGLINPILVRPEGAMFEIIAGHRRYLAHKWLGRTHIESILSENPHADTHILRLTENAQRSDLTPVEEAIAIRKLRDQTSLPLQDLAKRCGKSESWVRLRLQILDWPDDILIPLARLQIPIAVAGHLSAISDDLERKRLTYIAIESGANARTVMAWRAAWETTQTPVNTDVPTNAAAIAAGQQTNPLFPCWACNAPVDLMKLYIIRLCPECIVAMSNAKQTAAPAA